MGAEEFLKVFFPETGKENFLPSLFSMDLGEVSEIKLETVNQIHRHFLGYDYFVRDMPQRSARYDVISAFLRVDVNLESHRAMREQWSIEKKSDSYYPILHRRSLY